MSFVRQPNAEPIPGYRIIEPLGTGGFGEVWKCEAPGGLFKAIKFVYGNLNSLDGDGFRAEQELSALNRVKEVRHPFVLSMDRIEVVEGQLVIVMELADKSLHDAYVDCQASGLVGIPRDNLLRYIRDASEALDHMIEKHNLQHLDIKPRNLFLISDRVKVADFGLVKHIERQSGLANSATPLYAAPETFQGQISKSSDQYSLAIVYQELLTGQRPFNGKNPRQLVMQHTQEEPELRALPEPERMVLARALAKDPAKRFPSCLTFVRALYNAQQPRPETIRFEPVAAVPEGRSRTMAETMDDISFAQMDQAGPSILVAEAPPQPEEVSRLGLTMSLPQTGALRPTIIVGLGSFGRRAIQELRCRFLDRFGDLAKVPLIRFIYVDSDPEGIKTAARGGRDVACSTDEVCHLPLQPVGNYRRRTLEQLSEWLPREKLYAMPRSLQTQGSRALGRLAFADNHLRCLARLRSEIQQATHPDALYESVNQTGLALRDSRPRIYVIAAAGGGSSGMLVDMAYVLRNVLHQLRQPQGEITALVFCGAPEDPATPRLEQANVYATLTELNHFTDAAVPFTAQYGADGTRTVDSGQPFSQIYLLRLANRSPEAMRDSLAHLGSYLFHELTTPLGIQLERIRTPAGQALGTPFRSFGTYAVWFPRGLLLRQAARHACIRILSDWQKVGEPTASAEVDAACARLQSDPDLRFETLCVRVQELASAAFDGSLTGAMTALLSSLEEQSQASIAQDDPENWSKQAFNRVQEWVGAGFGSEGESGWKRSKLGRALSTAIQKITNDLDSRLGEVVFKLMEHPGLRVAAAEAAFKRLAHFVQEVGAAQHSHLDQQIARTEQAWHQVERALENCQEGVGGLGGFSIFGVRSKRVLRVFLDHLAAFGRQRLVEEIVAASLQCYTALATKLGERVRDLAYCRQRLRGVQAGFEAIPDQLAETPPTLGMDTPGLHLSPASTESYLEAMRQSRTARLVLPEAEEDLEKAAIRLVKSLTAEQWSQLDQAIHDRVLAPAAGLHQICLASGDLARTLTDPLLMAAANCLGGYLPVTDVAEVEFSLAQTPGRNLPGQIQAYFGEAAPLVASKDAATQHGFLLIPTSNAGADFGDVAKATVEGLELVRAPGQADLMFCREQGCLKSDDLQRIFRACQISYSELAGVPTTSPHARFDIQDWVPLDL
jgi:hypothetical protein